MTLTQTHSENKPLLQNDAGFLQEITSTAVEVGLEGEDATEQETQYQLVLKTIAELKLNDETSHIQKLQLCIALARGVLDLKPGEEPISTHSP